MPDEDDAIVHYAPGDHPLCGNDSMNAVYTDDPAAVAGCADCLELAAEDLDEDNEHWADCLHCQQEISTQSGVEWRRVVRAPCPHCGKAGSDGNEHQGLVLQRRVPEQTQILVLDERE